MAINLKITQVKSGIGRSASQNKTLEGLGLRGPHKSVVLTDTPAIRGMIRKIAHLVNIEEVIEEAVPARTPTGGTGGAVAERPVIS